MRYALGCLLLLVLQVCSGCTTYYRAETVLHSDGTIERAIYQPISNDAPVEQQGWDELRYVHDSRDAFATTPIRDIPAADKDKPVDSSYLTAWGRFEAVDKIPSHTEFKFSEKTDPTRVGKLQRKYERRDYTVLAEYVWEETLTDIVSLTDMRLAVGELADQFTADALEVVAQGMGDEHDLTQLRDWLERDVRAWFHEAVEAGYELAIRREMSEATIYRKLVEICARHGLVLPPEPLGQKETMQFVDSFVRAKLLNCIVRRDGQKLEPQAVRRLDGLLLLLTEQFDSQRPPAEVEYWKRVHAQVIERRYGSLEACQLRYAGLLQRIMGVHWAPRYFQYEMTMPGVIVETSGVLHGDSNVTWTFAGGDAFPFGYRMSCRSLAVNTAVLARLPGAQAPGRRDELVELVELLRGDERLREALMSSVRQEELLPLGQLKTALEAAGDAAAAARVKRVEALLGLE